MPSLNANTITEAAMPSLKHLSRNGILVTAQKLLKSLASKLVFFQDRPEHLFQTLWYHSWKHELINVWQQVFIKGSEKYKDNKFYGTIML